jgi:hypothetical protein
VRLAVGFSLLLLALSLVWLGVGPGTSGVEPTPTAEAAATHHAPVLVSPADEAPPGNRPRRVEGPASTDPELRPLPGDAARPTETDRVLVEFVVLLPDGAPAVGAHLTLEPGWVQGRVVAPFGLKRLLTDAQGRATFERVTDAGRFSVADLGRMGLRVNATDAEGLRAARQVEFFPPLERGPHGVRLLPAARVTIAVTEDGSMAVRGARVSIEPAGPDTRNYASEYTDSSGLAHFNGLAAGWWSYYVAAPSSEHNRRGTFELSVGEVGRVEVRLSDETLALALSGRYVDANGEPIGPRFEDRPGVWIGASLADGELIHTDALGRFRYYRSPVEHLIVRADTVPDAHRYGPAHLVVPFGTQDLVLRRSERLPQRVFYMRLSDEQSGEPLEQGRFTLYSAVSTIRSGSASKGEDGLHSFPYRARPGLRWTAYAAGYGWRMGNVDPTRHTTPEDALEVRLTRGLASHLVVLDSRTERPLPGARVVDKDGHEVAVADGTGALILTTSGPVRVSARGYVPRRWYASWWLERIYLDPR